jgi:hypothetical protein
VEEASLPMAGSVAFGPERHYFGLPPLFVPQAGERVIAPPGEGPGYWAGAPSVLFDREDGYFYLYYRLRVPRELGRGIECRIARSRDGSAFETIWSARKQEFPTDSMERAALFKSPQGRWRLYLSYVDPADNRWRIDVTEAADPAGFDVRSRQPVLTADDAQCEGVKDPYVILVGGQYRMYVSYATRPAQAYTAQELHGTADIFNTGKTTSNTGLALSEDGLHFRWVGDVFAPRAGRPVWDAYAARITSLLYVPPVFLAFYDGSASVAENYEEKLGLAVSLDLTRFERVTESGPLLRSPHGSGSIRYVDVINVDGTLHYYYEYALPDASHELRHSRVLLGGGNGTMPSVEATA